MEKQKMYGRSKQVIVESTTRQKQGYFKDNTFEYVNHLFKDKDCQHCGDEWEYQCYECEKAEKEQEEINK